MSDVMCTYCRVEFVSDQLVRLADGKEYCLRCIQEICPQVLDSREEDGSVSETVEYPLSRVFLNSFFSGTTMFLCIAILPALLMASVLDEVQPLITSLFLIALWLLCVLPTLVLNHAFSRWYPRTFRIRMGCIEVNLSSDKRIPMNHAIWTWGSSWRDTAYSTWPIGRKGILVIIPGYPQHPIFLGKDRHDELLWRGLVKLLRLPIKKYSLVELERHYWKWSKES